MKEEEIDLFEIIRRIKTGKKMIFICTGIFLFIGLLIVFGTPKEYRSEVILLVESGSSSSSVSNLIQQFGGLGDLNVSGNPNENALKPELYPNIIKSTPFLLEILNMSVIETKRNTTITLSDYLENHTKPSLISLIQSYTIGLPSKVINILKKTEIVGLSSSDANKPFKLTQKQYNLINSLKGCIESKHDMSIGTLQISVQMQDPIVATLITDSVVNCLTKYIIEYKTQKAKADLKFIETRHREAEIRYIKAQQSLAVFMDQNRNIILAQSRSEEERLRAEFNLAFNIYNSLSQQLEQAKVKVQEKTPVFKIIDPAKVPLQKSKPKTVLTLLIMVCVGVFIGLGIIFAKLIIPVQENSMLKV